LLGESFFHTRVTQALPNLKLKLPIPFISLSKTKKCVVVVTIIALVLFISKLLFLKYRKKKVTDKATDIAEKIKRIVVLLHGKNHEFINNINDKDYEGLPPLYDYFKKIQSGCYPFWNLTRNALYQCGINPDYGPCPLISEYEDSKKHQNNSLLKSFTGCMCKKCMCKAGNEMLIENLVKEITNHVKKGSPDFDVDFRDIVLSAADNISWIPVMDLFLKDNERPTLDANLLLCVMRTNHGKTPPIFSYNAKNIVMTTLIDLGVNLSYQDNQGNTALHYADHNSWPNEENMKIVRKVIEKNPESVNTVNNKGETSLLKIMKEDYFLTKAYLIEELLTLGANPNISCEKGITPLFLTIFCHNKISQKSDKLNVSLLTKKELDKRCNYKNKIIKKLMEHEADPYIGLVNLKEIKNKKKI